MKLKNLFITSLPEDQKIDIWNNRIIPAVLKKVNNPRMISDIDIKTADFQVKFDEIVTTFIVEGDNAFGGHLIEDFRVTLDLLSYKLKKVEMRRRGLLTNKDKWVNLGK
ncbi:hypothetical protein [Clostridium paridis]|uniref:Uncharacterized protein n=1 Tax=Clostridium paridis TaxID=2803863 RepID=A0A937FCU3_9CLOT|nr:hypothetical protein [Clostridium paridis]MBL4930908.1 hypothetical protein [Clostridium paridis]